MTEKKEPQFKEEKKPEIINHMTRAEMVTELMMMLNEVKDEDMPVVHQFIREAMSRKPSDR